ncbi:hypothetical protein [Salipiger sp.]|uniref:hypothetical protein n=1 Tax=Salipiger sp. TaxID=2078585 RepID=UPI003A97EFD0
MFDAHQKDIAVKFTPDAIEEDLLAGRYDAFWNEKTRPRKLAQVRRARKVFRALGIFDAEIPCSSMELDFFSAQHLGDETQARQATFTSKASAENWRKGYATILDVVSGRRHALFEMRRLDDDWAKLQGHLTGEFGAPVVYGSQEMIPITSLILRCRERGISVSDLNSVLGQKIFSELPKRQRRAMKTAVRWLHRLRGRSNGIPAELLPDVRPDDLSSANVACARVVPAIHPAFAELADQYLLGASEGKVSVTFGVKVRNIPTDLKSPARIANINGALRWLWHGLVALDRADQVRPFDPACLCDPSLVLDLIDACAAGRLGPVSNSQTRRDRVMDVIAFLDWHCPGLAASIPAALFEHRDIRRTTGLETADRRKKRSACLDFVNDPKTQRQFFLMPKTFLGEARPIIENFKAHSRSDGNGLSKDQNRALELGVLAALTAIITLYPARLSTISQFTIRGENSNICFPEDKRAESLVLDVPGYIVKNGNFEAGIELRPNGKVSPRETLRWYIKKVHPLVLRYKHKHSDRRRPNLLFTGLHIDTLRRYWLHHVPAMGLDMTPHMCRHFTASLLLHNGASMADVATLLGISEKVASQNYAFISRAKKIQDMMAVQAAIYREVEL